MEKIPCDVAFLDIEMKGINGVEVAEKLKAINPNINIIFATGFGSYRDIAFDLHASGYLIKPITAERVRNELENLRRPVASQRRLKVLTFGNFEVLFNNTPLVFKYQKSKEMLAYLIDRKGAMCSTGELMAVLFEDGDDHKAYYHRLRSDLIDTLSACGCEGALVQQRGILGVSVDKVDCDYYDWCEGKRMGILWQGEYMVQYSWSEYTAGVLERMNKR